MAGVTMMSLWQFFAVIGERGGSAGAEYDWLRRNGRAAITKWYESKCDGSLAGLSNHSCFEFRVCAWNLKFGMW